MTFDELQEQVKQDLKRHEGLRLMPYQCSKGNWTIGYGHLIRPDDTDFFESGITLDMAEKMLNHDMEESLGIACVFCVGIEGFIMKPAPIKRVLWNMAFNLGYNLMAFRLMQRAVDENNWNEMADQMIASQWYREVGDRSKELVNIVREYALEVAK